ncbi:hypothetical protein Rhe02_32980 [Rhizocola hellebori]|uniref:Uncharacterized protein n=1 Tax=Rhizocola hellebori TaxID=1392758 RepID=A0A8J3VGP1_9ACTN|nr:hypothetical protein [Rhizocola hellebori]GIH05231.1 hypothetical protein Rhe02_32980 [Rhizocola hellebori]
MFAAIFTAQIVAALGYGPWFAFSVPALYAGIAGDGQPGPAAIGYLSVGAVAAVSVAVTVVVAAH